jgi:hypothetical protein
MAAPSEVVRLAAIFGTERAEVVNLVEHRANRPLDVSKLDGSVQPERWMIGQLATLETGAQLLDPERKIFI